jgi:hypothetical protein
MFISHKPPDEKRQADKSRLNDGLCENALP